MSSPTARRRRSAPGSSHPLGSRSSRGTGAGPTPRARATARPTLSRSPTASTSSRTSARRWNGCWTGTTPCCEPPPGLRQKPRRHRPQRTPRRHPRRRIHRPCGPRRAPSGSRPSVMRAVRRATTRSTGCSRRAWAAARSPGNSASAATPCGGWPAPTAAHSTAPARRSPAFSPPTKRTCATAGRRGSGMVRSSGANCASAASSARPGSSASSSPAGVRRRGDPGGDHAAACPHRCRPSRRGRCPAGARRARSPGCSAGRTRTSRPGSPPSSTTARGTGRTRSSRARSHGSSTGSSARATLRRWSPGWPRPRRVACASSGGSSPGCAVTSPPWRRP